MASAASLGGGQVFAAKPVPDINNMDVAQAMALLGFNCSVSFYNTPMSDINDAFKSKIRDIHIKAKKKPNSNLKFKETTKIKIRKLNEALQFLNKKRELAATNAWKASSVKGKGFVKAMQGFSISMKEGGMAAERDESMQAYELASTLLEELDNKPEKLRPVLLKQTSNPVLNRRKTLAQLDNLNMLTEESQPPEIVINVPDDESTGVRKKHSKESKESGSGDNSKESGNSAATGVSRGRSKFAFKRAVNQTRMRLKDSKVNISGSGFNLNSSLQPEVTWARRLARSCSPPRSRPILRDRLSLSEANEETIETKVDAANGDIDEDSEQDDDSNDVRSELKAS